MFTFNQINKAFNDIAVAHKQINTYGIGDIWEIATSGTIRYPLMWAVPQTSTLEKNVYVSKWKLIFMDLVSKGEQNENDVLSDMELVALDVVALLQDPDYLFDFDPTGITLERFTEKFYDEVSGVTIDISIKIDYTSDKCAVPQSGLTIGTGSNFVSIINAITGATITTVNSPGSYSVYEFSGIQDSGAPYTNTILNP